jgi:F-type H+-transporting ATPase subunit b
MEFHPVDIIISIINIAVLFILLRLILWKPVNRYLSARAERVRADLEKAERSRDDAEALRLQYEQKLEGIETQGRDIMRDSQVKASEEAEDILKDAREKARTMLSDARERINEEKERAVINARREVAQLATDMAARILKREVLPDDSMSAVEDFFHEAR